MSLNYKKISEFFGVGVEKKFFSESELEAEPKKKLFSESELESESKKKFFRSRSRVSESKSVTPLITNYDAIPYPSSTNFNLVIPKLSEQISELKMMVKYQNLDYAHGNIF